MAGEYPSVDCTVVPVTDIDVGYDYPPEVSFEFSQQDLDSYRRAADFLNFSNADVVCLQHEYGLYGGIHHGGAATGSIKFWPVSMLSLEQGVQR